MTWLPPRLLHTQILRMFKQGACHPVYNALDVGPAAVRRMVERSETHHAPAAARTMGSLRSTILHAKMACFAGITSCRSYSTVCRRSLPAQELCSPCSCSFRWWPATVRSPKGGPGPLKPAVLRPASMGVQPNAGPPETAAQAAREPATPDAAACRATLKIDFEPRGAAHAVTAYARPTPRRWLSSPI